MNKLVRRTCSKGNCSHFAVCVGANEMDSEGERGARPDLGGSCFMTLFDPKVLGVRICVGIDRTHRLRAHLPRPRAPCDAVVRTAEDRLLSLTLCVGPAMVAEKQTTSKGTGFETTRFMLQSAVWTGLTRDSCVDSPPRRLR